MDPRLIKRLLILTAIWSILFLSILLTDSISNSVSTWSWIVYSILIGCVFVGLKLWNRKSQEPLLDINQNHVELSISVALAIMVSLFGGTLMQLGFMQSTSRFLLLTFVMTSLQFTLLKSVQPDPASPTHGFNREVAISKSIYFCLLAFIKLSCEAYNNTPISSNEPSLVLYRFDLLDRTVIELIGDICLIIVLAFPLIFVFGLLPQITTFIIYNLEQIDIHFFGSTASTLGLKSAVYSFSRSSLVVLFLYLIALQSIGNQQLFSLFCGLLLSVGYFLSRNSSDVTASNRIFIRLLRGFIPAKQPRSLERVELDDLSPPVVITQEPVVVIPQPELVEAATSTPQVQSEESTASEGDEDSTAAINSQETTITSNNNDSNNNNQNAENNECENNGSTLGRDEKEPDTDSISTRIQSSIDDICISRLKKDLVICFGTVVIIFALHVTTVFSLYHNQILKYFSFLAIAWGILFHCTIPQLRRDIPCMFLAEPMLKPREYDFFEVKAQAKLMWYEKLYFLALAFEKNFIYPVFWLNVISHDATTIRDSYGYHVGPLLLVIMSLKLIRSSFNDSSANFIIIGSADLFFNYDFARYNHRIFLLNYFVFSILYLKVYELLLKLKFIYIYIAPWQIPWGSAFHAFAQPFSVPHSPLLFGQAILSSILSAPLQPVLGSAIFMMSYVRPVKFWERDYNTNVIDINSTRLVTQLERNRIDSNRLDGIFYEHLTKSLQRKLCKDLAYGRWGHVSQGDCFIMASDNLNCLVHIIELGNGFCTFQLRGLEFRGTYCQQQEVEAISESVNQDDGFCCCQPGHLPNLLSANAAFNQLWLAWHVTHTHYVLEGYTISDNPAGPMLQPFDLRRALVTYYVKAIIYFTITSPHLSKWLRTAEFHEALERTKDKMYADLDPTFSSSLDLDFEPRLSGVTRTKFCSVYFEWIKYCVDRVKNDKNDVQRAKMIADLDCNPDSFLLSLCYGLSLLARRSLSAAADGQQFHTVESLLFGLHALLKGDFRITSMHDEWIFQEMRFFKLVVIPGVRMALKLHQDHFAAPDDYDDNMVLYEAIAGYQQNLVISHETDVAWRAAVLSGVPSLLTLRLYTDDGSNQYKFIMLNRRYISFRIIKINRECVRGFWASQQQELIFFRNTDPERGSIQNAKQALRNMINSSCDQPVGYPIYVSPLTTSYFECGTMSSFIT